MKKLVIISLLFLIAHGYTHAQTYFPPSNGNWETITWEEAGLCPDSLNAVINLLQEMNSKAFVLLYNGKILNETYFGDFTADSVWYWASAGKTLTSALMGIAAADNGLNLDAPTSDYIGTGWTSLSPAQESAITVRHQLTMTTGLDDGVIDDDCTLPACLQYLANPGTRWAYHNAPYTLLDNVLQTATGFTNNQYFFQKIGTPCGINGLFINSGYNKVFYSTPRNMAKYGLLLQNQGVWNGNTIIPYYYHQWMTTPSQNLNLSYGYLTWLNGQSSYMVPESQFVIPGMMAPHAPPETYAALGKNGQIINVSPNENITWIRMGNGNNELINWTLLDNVWSKLQFVLCNNHVEDINAHPWVTITNNGKIPQISSYPSHVHFRITNALGAQMYFENTPPTLDHWKDGIYFLSCPEHPEWTTLRFIIQH